MALNDKQTSPRKWKNRTMVSSLEFALTGIFTAFREERNMRKHLLSAVLVLVAGFVFRISLMEWVALILCISLVMVLEIVNSAIENVVDLASDYHFSMLTKNAKDMAAGAVLVMSIGSAIVGCLIFLPKVWQLLFS